MNGLEDFWHKQAMHLTAHDSGFGKGGCIGGVEIAIPISLHTKYICVIVLLVLLNNDKKLKKGKEVYGMEWTVRVLVPYSYLISSS